MVAQKRQGEGSAARAPKRVRTEEDASASTSTDKPKPSSAQPRPVFTSALMADEGDFPRGGGTTLTPLEYKEVRDEGRKEAEKDVEAERKKRRTMQNKRNKGKDTGSSKKEDAKDKDAIRVEHLNYKRLTPGTRLLTRVHSVLNLHLILSLPNQLLAHVPITEISNTLTHLLTKDEKDSNISMDDEADDDDDSSTSGETPDLSQLFQPGQYLLATISQSFPSESSNKAFLSLYPPSEATRLASRVEMSLVPEKVNQEVSKLDVTKGYRITGEVKGEEDHGWIVGLGVEGIEGFLRKEDVKGATIFVGQVLDAVVSEVNGRIVRLSIDRLAVSRTQQQEVTTITSLLPGHVVSALITSIVPSTGLNLKIFGTFDSTIDLAHLPVSASADLEDTYKIGKKVKARIIFETVGVSGKVFGLSLLPHVIEGKSPVVDGQDVEQKMTIGTICEDVEVEKVEKEWGLVCTTGEGYRAFVHMSHVADVRPASLSGTGPFRVGTKHKARVLGHSPFDGLVLLSFEKKVIDQKFMLVSEVKVGEMMKGTITKLTEKALFVDVHGSVQGVVFPMHYADIKLKHPEKRFKTGQSVKCRVFSIEPEKGRVKLTLKKSLVEATEAIPLSFEDVKADMITPGLITKVFDKGCLVEMFSGIVAYVPLAEVSDAFITDLKTAVFEGKPVKIKITSVDRDTQKLFASIRQALPANIAAAAIQIDDVVSGEVAQIHQDQVVLKLIPSQRKAILALGNLAHHRGIKVADLKTSLKIGEKLEDLVVVVKSEDTGLIIVANKQKPESTGASSKLNTQTLNMADLKPGQIVPARVTKKNAQGYFLSITRNVIGRLHPTDMADDYDKTPEIEQGDIVKCCVIKVDAEARQLDLSTRPSRVDAAASSGKSIITDREIETLTDLKAGQKIRGIVKNITGSGLYVNIGRTVTARVMIKEMFDDYVADWQSKFEIGQVVQGKILTVDAKKEQVEMSLKKKASKSKDKKSAGLADFKVDQKVDTVVRKVEDYGIFLKINGTEVSGLCHRSEVADDKKADVAQALKSFRVGDKLKAKITAIDTEANKISFGIKPSYFDAEDFGGQAVKGEDEDLEMGDEEVAGEEQADEAEDDEEEDEEEDEEDDAEMNEDEEDETEGEDGFLDVEAEVDSDDDDAMEDEEEGDVEEESDEEVVLVSGNAKANKSKKAKQSAAASGLPITGGFSWNGAATAAEDAEDADSSSSDDSDDDEEDESGKMQKKRKGGHQPIKDLTGEIRTKQPESTAEFERALLASPNSSFLWIQFMSFQLALSEIEKAKDIGRRALTTIAFREEEEKLNVWMALINLENAHGTSESFDKLFKEAAQYNDAKTVYLRTASILQQTEKLDAAAEIYGKACKKFGQSIEPWTGYAEFEFVARDDAEAARALLPRSLKSLPTSEHSKTIEKFAILEFRHGDQERGRTIFEGLVDRYPKRLDIWNNYIDQVVRLADIQSCRGLIDRALDQKLTPKKAKFLFKKLLFVEDRIGDEAGKQRAKTKAREWVLSQAKADEQ